MSKLRHQEIIDRVHYMYLQTDGTIEFPNSFEGDLLKIAYGTAVQSIKQPQLNPNQHVVLDWLKKHFYKEDDNYPLVSVCRFVEEDTGDKFSDVGLAYGYLTMKQEAQVLLAFANWTMEQEEE
ncbi:hypothetical protein [Enterococcus faecalis]|uniref:hypothetical protein n=1 Tax=Enterococcus faecalis TaxID=1351 RepID=UPI001A03D93F|nr:hypothetical protein [Enterococcus faecalis]EGQ1195559.1 hypothetical protein [Listeria monocytogenes]MCE2562315.1 hypothetical protein [Enterococcus faecalis]